MDLELVDAFRAAGVPDDKARAVVISLHREIDRRFVLHAGQLATRGDLGDVRVELNNVKAELKRDVGEVKAELKRDVGEVKAELKHDVGEVKAELKHDVAQLKAEVTHDLADVKLEMARLHADAMSAIARLETRMTDKIGETKVELIRWFLGSFIAIAGAVAAITRMLPR